MVLLFRGIKDEHGDLIVRIGEPFSSEVWFDMPKEFWNMFLKRVEELRNNKENYKYCEGSEKTLIDNIANILKKKLEG
ncbi:hypothetical protein ES705_07761 [subsurface metagenome]